MSATPKFVVRGYDSCMRLLGETEHADQPSASAEAKRWLRRIKDRKDRAAHCEVSCLQINTVMTGRVFVHAFEGRRGRPAALKTGRKS